MSGSLTTLLSVPLDLVKSILSRLQFSDRLALLCVSRRVDVLHRCSSRDCQGLCKRCMTAYKFCGVECGICSSPSSERQEELLRVETLKFLSASNCLVAHQAPAPRPPRTAQT
eukprot:SM000270S10381  [mRNA]  locus=s270:8892:12604:- [translate_table: standard]